MERANSKSDSVLRAFGKMGIFKVDDTDLKYEIRTVYGWECADV